MPYLRDGGGGSADTTGAIGSGLGMTTMVVQPDRILTLRNDLTTIRDEVREFLIAEGIGMRVQPPGADPVSRDGPRLSPRTRTRQSRLPSATSTS